MYHLELSKHLTKVINTQVRYNIKILRKIEYMKILLIGLKNQSYALQNLKKSKYII